VFWVKSVYKVQQACEVTRQRRNIASGARGSIGEIFWRKLWQLDCPQKIKYFLWRLSHNTLAVRKVSQRRGMSFTGNAACAAG
jgi:hypothetical protein